MDILVKSHQLFVTSVATAMVYSYDREKLVEEIFKLEKNSASNQRSNAGGFQSYHYDQQKFDNPYTAELIKDNIMPILGQVADSWGFPKTENISYWYNVNRKYNYNHQHYHPGSVLSGAFYIKVPKNSGNIVFMRSSSEADRMDYLTTYQHETGCLFPDNVNSNVMNHYAPVENLLVIFPGHLEHYVEQNNTKDEDDARISLSFNYFLG